MQLGAENNNNINNNHNYNNNNYETIPRDSYENCIRDAENNLDGQRVYNTEIYVKTSSRNRRGNLICLYNVY